jgi:ubiquinone/menaquinone biosynthesis C-methylase UbiE
LPSTVWQKKREIIRHYDELASMYDSLYRDEQDLKIEHVLKHVNFDYSDSVLDAGCGTGFLFEHVHRHVGHLVGVDLSSGLLRVALAHIKQAGMKTVSLARADVDHLPFKERVFDKVFALTLIQDFSGSSMTLRKMMRTAKEESVFVITGLKKVFSEASFKQFLHKAGLEPNILLTSEQVKDIIAVCQKHRKAKDK